MGEGGGGTGVCILSVSNPPGSSHISPGIDKLSCSAVPECQWDSATAMNFTTAWILIERELCWYPSQVPTQMDVATTHTADFSAV